MKKTIIIAAIFVGLVLVAVGYDDDIFRTSVGRDAPSFAVTRNDTVFSPSQYRGSYVLLNFWETTDAPSRRAANEYTAWMRSHPHTGMRLMSVNLDDNELLFKEIVKTDSLRPSEQFFAGADARKAIIDTYGLTDGYGSLLIDPQGKIAAHNPTPALLSRIMRR